MTKDCSVNLSLGIFCTLFSITLTMGLASSSITKVSADSSVSANASVNVSAACTMSSVVDTAHTATINPDTNQPNIGQTSVTVTCNDPGGYAIYAIGYSGTPSTLGNTDLINTVSSSQTIATGTATSGNNSNWSMKLAPGTASASSKAATIITTPTDYSNYANVPSSYDKVATFASTTDGTGGSSFTTTYQAYISHSQPAGTYDGKVKYALVHPNNAPAPTVPTNLYNAVATMSKGKQTAAQLQAAITIPTSADRTQDTSNSGVYEYDPAVFGTASDASNANKIYYYRGVLENSPGTYGSDGSAVTYPNYVKLGNTCWRIVRTTGSGGVKMIYNGLYGATTAGSCANTQTNAQVATSAFDGTDSTYRQIVRVGYTHNSTYAVNTSQSGTIAQVFGSNSNPGANDTRSDIKTYIEDTWYTGTNGVSAYTNMLEPSAGYCNDRTMNTTKNWTTPLAESTNIDSTYGTSVQTYYFGASPRTESTAQLPSLACGNKYSQIDRSIVDLYRYNGTNGAAGSTTANYLKYPAALLTADEAALAGSGWSSSTTPYHGKSFLRSGSNFWLLSPYFRYSNDGAREFYLYSSGDLLSYYMYFALGVRPAISLKAGTVASSGSGIATDPWVVDAP